MCDGCVSQKRPYSRVVLDGESDAVKRNFGRVVRARISCFMAEVFHIRVKDRVHAYPVSYYMNNRASLRKAMRGYQRRVTLREKMPMWHAQFGHCNGCFDWLKPRHMQIDHITPISRGGSDDPSNKQLLCYACNSSKNAKTMVEFRMWQDATGFFDTVSDF